MSNTNPLQCRNQRRQALLISVLGDGLLCLAEGLVSDDWICFDSWSLLCNLRIDGSFLCCNHVSSEMGVFG